MKRRSRLNAYGIPFYGRGTAHGVSASRSGRTIAIAAGSGSWVYDLNDEEPKLFSPAKEFGDHRVAIDETGSKLACAARVGGIVRVLDTSSKNTTFEARVPAEGYPPGMPPLLGESIVNEYLPISPWSGQRNVVYLLDIQSRSGDATFCFKTGAVLPPLSTHINDSSTVLRFFAARAFGNKTPAVDYTISFEGKILISGTDASKFDNAYVTEAIKPNTIYRFVLHSSQVVPLDYVNVDSNTHKIEIVLCEAPKTP